MAWWWLQGTGRDPVGPRGTTGCGWRAATGYSLPEGQFALGFGLEQWGTTGGV